MFQSRSRGALVLVLSLALGATGGCATSEQAKETGDPLEPMNRAVYDFNEVLDRNLIGPIAQGYVAVTPEPARHAVTNFFDNAGYPWVVINAFLQGKILQGFEDAGRFIVNTVFGLGGLIDFASGVGLARHDEDLGQTLGVWGMGEGFYLVLPILGPNAFRDLPNFASTFVDPLNALDSAERIGATVLDGINLRANADSAIRVREETALDPYVFTREAYRQRREFLIHDGNPPLDDIDDFE